MAADTSVSKVGRNTVTDGGPVTVTGNGADSLLPPVARSPEGLFSVGPQTVTSGGRYRYRERALCYRHQKNYAQPCTRNQKPHFEHVPPLSIRACLNPNIDILYPTPYNLYPMPCTLYPKPYTPNPKP